MESDASAELARFFPAGNASDRPLRRFVVMNAPRLFRETGADIFRLPGDGGQGLKDFLCRFLIRPYHLGLP